MSDSRHAETGARKTYRMVRYFFGGVVSRACLCISVPRKDCGLAFVRWPCQSYAEMGRAQS